MRAMMACNVEEAEQAELQVLPTDLCILAASADEEDTEAARLESCSCVGPGAAKLLA